MSVINVVFVYTILPIIKNRRFLQTSNSLPKQDSITESIVLPRVFRVRV